MLEKVHETWKSYATLIAPSWGADDPRHNLATEVRDRLEQMDVLMADVRRLSEQWNKDIGGLSPETYPAFHELQIHLRLSVESFYIVGWRVLRCLNQPSPLSFPNIGDVRVPSVEKVAEALLGIADGRSITQSMVHTEAGPVLGETAIVIEGGTGRTYPSSDSADMGLFVTAEQFRMALEKALGDALGEVSRGRLA